ncbi:MAG: type II toxin-antitoxin system VapC family toxin [Pirellulales bacterium]|nr:type II toxin-antitoxin system VapC family toxin [Pirellulales bacterium]
MIVADTNVIAYLYLAGDHSVQAAHAFLKDPYWAAPLLWRSELRNVLVLYLRNNRIERDDAQWIIDDALRMMHGREHEVDSHQVLHLAVQSVCTAYDCEFVALAQDLEVPLVTTDRQILDQFPDTAVSLEQFVVGE